MARLRKDSLLAALSGALGKEIVFKQYRDKTIITKFPDMSNAGTSEKQKVRRELFKEAVDYASKINKDPVLKAKYEKKLKKNENVYHFAIKEFFKRRKKA
jgi:hypothetical protein